MKTLLRGVAAAAMVAAAAPAFAVPGASVPADNRLFISGATATNNALFQLPLLINGGLCASGTIDVYQGTNQFAIACTGRTGTTVAGLPIAIIKESNGGSGNGTGPVARQESLDFMNLSAPGCTGSSTVPATSTLEEYTENTGCDAVVSLAPPVGIADVNPELFTVGSSPVDAATAALLSSSALLQIVFAPAVSENLYRALQLAQGLPQDDDEANVPNLTRSQLHALYSGAITDWRDLQTNTGDAFATGATAPSSGLPLVFVCRRGQNSGTQAAFAAFVLNERCNSTVAPFRAPSTGNANSGDNFDPVANANTLVFAARSSGNVRACLDDRNDNGRYAIGVLSTESVTETAGDFRFVGIDGAAPTLQSVANGGYHFITENVLNTGPVTLTLNQTRVRDFITGTIGAPDIIAALNVPTQRPEGDHGSLGTPGLGLTAPNDPNPTVTEATMRLRPISSMRRNGNNCQPASAAADAQILGGLQ